MADITNFVFKSGGNIEKINQNVLRGLFGMQFEASFAEEIGRKQLDLGLKQTCQKAVNGNKSSLPRALPAPKYCNLVSKEPQCLVRLLQAKKGAK